MTLAELVERWLAQLHESGEYEERSPIDASYNCVAFAAGDTTRFWSPKTTDGYSWPADAPADETVGGVMAALSHAGFVECLDASFEDGYEKVAVFAIGDFPTHAARQDAVAGGWLSKLGKEYDIAHASLAEVGGEVYGEPVAYMRRDRSSPPTLPSMRPSGPASES